MLFLKPKDEHIERWDGLRTGVEGAKTYFGMHQAFPIDAFPGFLEKIQKKAHAYSLFTDLNFSIFPPETSTASIGSMGLQLSNTHATQHPSEQYNLPSFLQRFYDATSFFSTNKPRVEKIAPLLHQLRLNKSQAEIKLMRRSGQISGQSFAKAMSLTRPGMTEHQLQACLQYEMLTRGSSHMAYVPVVAGGKNALTLHYTRNNQVLKDGDLVLVDAGGVSLFQQSLQKMFFIFFKKKEYGYYASDITRTWPINGKFSPAQRKVYEIVLSVQKMMISVRTLSFCILIFLYCAKYSSLSIEMSRRVQSFFE
jgi:intermediate cleaving peptidase 55